FSIACTVGRVSRPFKFSYAVANGSPQAVYQRVHLSLSSAVNSAAFMFEHIQGAGILVKDRCAAIVHGEDIEDESEARSSLEMLKEFATVIDVTDANKALKQISEVAGNGQH